MSNLLPASKTLATLAHSLYAYIDSDQLQPAATNAMLDASYTTLAQIIADPNIADPLDTWLSAMRQQHRAWMPPRTA